MFYIPFDLILNVGSSLMSAYEGYKFLSLWVRGDPLEKRVRQLEQDKDANFQDLADGVIYTPNRAGIKVANAEEAPVMALSSANLKDLTSPVQRLWQNAKHQGQGGSNIALGSAVIAVPPGDELLHIVRDVWDLELFLQIQPKYPANLNLITVLMQNYKGQQRVMVVEQERLAQYGWQVYGENELWEPKERSLLTDVPKIKWHQEQSLWLPRMLEVPASSVDVAAIKPSVVKGEQPPIEKPKKTDETEWDLVAWRHFSLVLLWPIVGTFIVMVLDKSYEPSVNVKAPTSLAIIALIAFYLWYYRKILNPLSIVLGLYTIAGFWSFVLETLRINGYLSQYQNTHIAVHSLSWIILIGQYLLWHRAAKDYTAMTIGLIGVNIALVLFFMSLYKFFHIELFHESNYLSGVVAASFIFLGQYTWRHRHAMNTVAMVWSLSNIGIAITVFFSILFDVFKVSLGDKYESEHTGAMIGFLVSLFLLAQYLWRHRRSLDHLAIVWSLFALGLGLSGVFVNLFEIFDIYSRNPFLGAIVGSGIAALLGGIYLWKYRASMNFVPMTIGLSGIGIVISIQPMWMNARGYAFVVIGILLILILILAWLRLFLPAWITLFRDSYRAWLAR